MISHPLVIEQYNKYTQLVLRDECDYSLLAQLYSQSTNT